MAKYPAAWNNSVYGLALLYGNLEASVESVTT